MLKNKLAASAAPSPSDRALPPVIASNKRITTREWKERAKLINRLLKKDVSVIHVEGTMTLLERKIYNVLLLNAYDKLGEQSVHTMPTWILCDLLGYNSQNTQHLEIALTNLMTTTVQFNLLRDGKREWKAAPMLAQAEISDGVCTYYYSPVIAEWLRNPEVYTNINLSVINEFRTVHGLTLYENCVRFRDIGQTGAIDLDLFRILMGAHRVKSYEDFKEFRRAVIDKAVKEINSCSDILVEPSFVKEGHRVTGVSFKVKRNQQRRIFSDDIDDPRTKIRQTPLFIRLLSYGVPDQLAELYAEKYNERAAKAIEYLEAEVKKQPERIRNKTAYLRTLIESGVDLNAPVERIEQTTAQILEETLRIRREAERSNAKKAIIATKTKQAINSLPPDHVRELVREFGETFKRKEAISTGDDGYPVHKFDRNLFLAWLRSRIKVDAPTEEEIDEAINVISIPANDQKLLEQA